MRLYLLFAACVLLVASGCDSGKKSARGFRLPDGDTEKGKAVFLTLKCNGCHEVSGTDLPLPAEDAPAKVTLGGEVRRIQTYGELVTSIINPSHKLVKRYPQEKVAKDGQSKMTNFNEVMTVSQLIDLVAFLQSHYKIKVDDSMYYPYP